MKKSTFGIFFALLMTASTIFAQQAENGNQKVDEYKSSAVLKAYRTNMKSKNYARAKQEIDGAIKKYPEAAVDAQLYKYKMDALNALIVAENRKIYLNSKPDTVTYFNYVYELYTTGLTCDSIEQALIRVRQAMGKKAKPRLRYTVAQSMLSYRKNMLNAGKYHYKKKDYVKAYQFLHLYAQTKTAPVFADKDGNSLLADPDDMREVASLATLSAYASGNFQGVMAYIEEGLTVEHLKPQLLELGAKSAAQLQDTTRMLVLLETGFLSYPDVEYFFMTLIKHYNEQKDYHHALQNIMTMVELYPEKRDYWYMAGTEQMLLAQYNEALVSFRKCIELQADDAQAYSAIGNIYLHDAQTAYAHFDTPISHPDYAQQKQQIDFLYQQACTAFEHARQFDENNQALWLSGLREAYFKLNRGRELRALEKYK
jgi:tetratricopeptide (TPR) repeat protein